MCFYRIQRTKEEKRKKYWHIITCWAERMIYIFIALMSSCLFGMNLIRTPTQTVKHRGESVMIWDLQKCKWCSAHKQLPLVPEQSRQHLWVNKIQCFARTTWKDLCLLLTWRGIQHRTHHITIHCPAECTSQNLCSQSWAY